jgi:thymine dioxygenase
LIEDTTFSSIAVNQNFQTAIHTDQGDLKGSFGVLMCFKRGDFTGGELIFPKFRVAVDFREGDVLLADVHEAHGNTPILGEPGEFTRMSCVFYFRERILHCGSVMEEAEFLYRRKVGDPLIGWLIDGQLQQ